MLKFLTAIAIAAAAFAGTAAKADERPSLVTILTAENPQTQVMGMVLTMQAIRLGSKAYILLSGPAGDLSLKKTPATATAPQKPKNMSPQGLMKSIMAKGGIVEVCAIYLPNKGVGTDALIKGVGSAKPPAMAARLLAVDTRIMSF